MTDEKAKEAIGRFCQECEAFLDADEAVYIDGHNYNVNRVVCGPCAIYLRQVNANLYVFEGDGEAGQVVYDGPFDNVALNEMDGNLFKAVQKAVCRPGEYVHGTDAEGCPFTVLVGEAPA